MKTKAYKLAAELGLKEQSVLDWLRANGYPNVRRADMIRADVAQAARVALGREKRSLPKTNPGFNLNRVRPTPSRREGPKPARLRDGAGRHEVQRGVPNSATERANFTMSFAELLEGHLPAERGNQEHEASMPGDDDHSAQFQTMEMVTPLLEPTSETAADVRVILSEQEVERLKAEAQVSAAKVEGLERLLQQANDERAKLLGLQSANTKAQEELAKIRESHLTAKEALRVEVKQREALEQTCSELQSEIADLQSMVGEIDSLQFDHDSVLGDLENARQREVAWRKRALELERAAHAGDDLNGLLRTYGLETGREQLRVLQAILGNEKLSGHLIKAIRQVDATVIRKIVEEQVAPACVDPLCRQIVYRRGQTPFRVDDDTKCSICAGSTSRRWYAKLADECERAGLKRVLLLGGDEGIQDRLRGLSEGRAIDFRLVAQTEDTNPARIRGRVEGCDVLVSWIEPRLRCVSADLYIAEARIHDKLVVEVLGSEPSVPDVARAVTQAAARNHLLNPY